MKAISGKQLCRLLVEGRGCVLRRVAGSHHIYSKAGNPARISVPVHGDTLLNIGPQRHLMKLSDIMESEL